MRSWRTSCDRRFEGQDPAREGRADDHEDGTDPAASQLHRRRMGTRVRRGRYAIYNPARPRECLGEFADSTEADVATAIDAAARSAADAWANTPPPQRGAVLFRFAQLLEESKTELARIVTLEQGKALAEAAGEVGRAAAEARFMAGEASRAMRADVPERAGRVITATRSPNRSASSPRSVRGIFRSSRPVRKIAPALTWGNTVVFKPSSLTPWSAVFLMQLLEKAGVPPRVVNLVTGPGARVGDALDPGRTESAGSRSRARRPWARRSTRRRRGGWRASSSSSAARIRRSSSTAGSRRCGAGDRGGGISVQRAAVHGDQPRDRRRGAGRCAGRTDRVPRRRAIKVGDGLEPGTTMGPLVSHGQLRTRRAVCPSGRGVGLRSPDRRPGADRKP